MDGMTEQEKEIIEFLKLDWMDKYNIYLHSEAWKNRRGIVLERDNHICQSCHKVATEVHHLTYDRVGCELLADLTSLCQDCHKGITAISRMKRIRFSENWEGQYFDNMIWGVAGIKFGQDFEVIDEWGMTATQVLLRLHGIHGKFWRDSGSRVVQAIKFLFGIS